jgi:hypothetical protein
MRSDHEFEFPAVKIAEAAKAEAGYHEQRRDYWQGEYDAAVEIVEKTCGAKVEKQAITGGYTVSVVVDYGDPAAYQRMTQAFRKWQSHLEEAERFRTDARLYGTQNGRVYELSTEDVHYFRLGSGPRED